MIEPRSPLSHLSSDAAQAPQAPPWSIAEWLNAEQLPGSEPLSLEALRGRVIALHAFQMLCPGCVSHGIPQAQRLQASFGPELAVIGLHSVFEHHDAMGPNALRAFLHEYRVDFPVGIDARDGDARVPKTMQAYGLRGTPSLILIDGAGRIRYHAFGRPQDIEVGAYIGFLLHENRDVTFTAPEVPASDDSISHPADARCDSNACTL